MDRAGDRNLPQTIFFAPIFINFALYTNLQKALTNNFFSVLDFPRIFRPTSYYSQLSSHPEATYILESPKSQAFSASASALKYLSRRNYQHSPAKYSRTWRPALGQTSAMATCQAPHVPDKSLLALTAFHSFQVRPPRYQILTIIGRITIVTTSIGLTESYVTPSNSLIFHRPF